MILRQTRFKPQSTNQEHQQGSRVGAYRVGFIMLPLLFVILGVGVAQAETLNVQVSVVSLNPARVKIEGERSKETRAWSFRNGRTDSKC